MNNKVIYTCLVGNYDSLIQPLVVDNEFDYICFSNDINEEKKGVWKIYKIPPIFEKNKRRLSRYVKLMPHKVLNEYIYSIWIDANIQIVKRDFYDSINKCIDQGEIICQVEHPLSNCIYEEIKRAYKDRKVSLVDAIRQYNHLKSMKYPINNGLYENNLIFRKHNEKEVVLISNDWWREYCSFSERDQFSLMYIYWRYNFTPHLLFEHGQNTRNVSCLKYCRHMITNTKKRSKARLFVSEISTCLRSLITIIVFKS